MKRKIIVFIMLIILMITSTVIGAFLTSTNSDSLDFTVGKVEAEVYAYFQRGNSTMPEDFLEIDMTSASQGVVTLNITDTDQLTHFDNFKVRIKIYSNVDTYFRVAIYEQFTLTYTVGGNTTVIATTRNDYAPFNFNEYLSDMPLDNGKFYDNRNVDGYFYYTDKVRRIDDNTPLELEFIKQAIMSHDIFPSRYTLQVGFIIEAVQAYDGPQQNWKLSSPPWPGQSLW